MSIPAENESRRTAVPGRHDGLERPSYVMLIRAGVMQFAPLLLFPFLAVAAADAVTVRVQDTRGGPQIHVDGKPIPSAVLLWFHE